MILVTKYAFDLLFRHLYLFTTLPGILIIMLSTQDYGMLTWYLILIVFVVLFDVFFSGVRELTENQKLMFERLDPALFLEKSRHLFARAVNPAKPLHLQIRLEKWRALMLLNETEAAERIVEELLNAPVVLLPVMRAQLLSMQVTQLLKKGETEVAQQVLGQMEVLLKSCHLNAMQKKVFDAFWADMDVLNGKYEAAEAFYAKEVTQPKLPLLSRLSCYAELGNIYEKTGRTVQAIQCYQYVQATCKNLPFFNWVSERLATLNTPYGVAQ